MILPESFSFKFYSIIKRLKPIKELPLFPSNPCKPGISFRDCRNVSEANESKWFLGIRQWWWNNEGKAGTGRGRREKMILWFQKRNQRITTAECQNLFWILQPDWQCIKRLGFSLVTSALVFFPLFPSIGKITECGFFLMGQETKVATVRMIFAYLPSSFHFLSQQFLLSFYFPSFLAKIVLITISLSRKKNQQITQIPFSIITYFFLLESWLKILKIHMFLLNVK